MIYGPETQRGIMLGQAAGCSLLCFLRKSISACCCHMASAEEQVPGYQMGTLCREISYPVVRLDNLLWRKEGDLCWNYS